MSRVLVTGASGFIGRTLVEALVTSHTVVAISRDVSSKKSQGHLIWKKCDLFSLIELEQVAQDCDVAIYLIHSMAPSSRLVQGSFSDIDLLLADNFRRAMDKAGVKKVIYLGGLIPPASHRHSLSRHLKSRLEVEQTLSACKGQFYAVRAGLIIGRGGSSFEMMVHLVRRLPMMVCPKWTQNNSHPIALEDVINILTQLVVREDVAPGCYDIGGRDKISYVDLMTLTGKILGHQPKLIMTNILSLSLSKIWVSLFGSAPMELVAPLVESLKHEMMVSDWILQAKLGLQPLPLQQALAKSIDGQAFHRDSQNIFKIFFLHHFFPSAQSHDKSNGVISIQRIELPTKWSAYDVARDYTRWLHTFFRPMIKVFTDAQSNVTFCYAPLGVAVFQFTLLKLAYSSERSLSDRVLFYVAGGLLDDHSESIRGRLEFREVLDQTKILATVLRFKPRLPWPIYLVTQAQVHLLVMFSFNRHLRKISKRLKSKSITQAKED